MTDLYFYLELDPTDQQWRKHTVGKPQDRTDPALQDEILLWQKLQECEAKTQALIEAAKAVLADHDEAGKELSDMYQTIPVSPTYEAMRSALEAMEVK